MLVTANAEASEIGRSKSIDEGHAGEILTESSQQTDIESLIRQEFGSEGDKAVAIAKCESSLDPSRIGDKHMDYWSYGLFQINQTWHKYSKETLLDPVQNVRIAHEIYLKGGWDRWSCNRIVALNTR